MRLIELAEIEHALGSLDLIPAMEAGFIAYSRNRAVVPPVGELLLEDPPGEVHIKYGYLVGDAYYVIKVASGFYENPSLGLPSGDGLMLVFRQETGEPVALLADRAHLTDVRTAVAGAVAARQLAPPVVARIGVLGTGVQARLQIRHLEDEVECRRLLVWGRSPGSLEKYRAEMVAAGYEVATTLDSSEVAPECELIITATPSRTPLVTGSEVKAGTHITAVGSDTVGKQELDVSVLGKADRVVADSLSQCRERGEIAAGLAAGVINEEDIVELGAVLAGDAAGRSAPEEITVADLTGLAVQDVQAATEVLRALGAPDEENSQ
jgi:ornithine cyclodeaminase